MLKHILEFTTYQIAMIIPLQEFKAQLGQIHQNWTIEQGFYPTIPDVLKFWAFTVYYHIPTLYQRTKVPVITNILLLCSMVRF